MSCGLNRPRSHKKPMAVPIDSAEIVAECARPIAVTALDSATRAVIPWAPGNYRRAATRILSHLAVSALVPTPPFSREE